MEHWHLALALGLGFIVTHHTMSHHPIRERLRDMLGANGFLGVYSVVSTIFYGPLAYLWWTETATTPLWWAFRTPAAIALASALITAGLVLTTGALLSPSRTSMAATMAGTTFTEVRGMSVFTRHPVFGGMALFSLGHLVVDGGAVDVAFHGTNIIVSVLGGLHQDQRAQIKDPDYAHWMTQTRLVPLPWPVAGGKFGTQGWMGLALGLAASAGARWLLH